MQEKNIPRDTLAEAMGVAPATISNISTGKVYPSVKFLIEVSEYLDVDIREMFVSTKGGVLTSVDKQKLKDVLNEGINLLNS